MPNNFLEALDRFRRGEMVIVVDDHDRENEGDLIMLAEHATAEKTAFMVRHTTGILCVAITAEHAHQLRLPYMVEQSQDVRKTAFTVSIDLAEGHLQSQSIWQKESRQESALSNARRPFVLSEVQHHALLTLSAQDMSIRLSHIKMV
ncbi:MAG: hypothetical protein RLZ23_521 [Actinomycetota bacterium]